MDGENVLPVPGWDRPCPLWDIWPHVCRPGQWRGGLSDSETGGFCMATASFWGIGLTGLTGLTGSTGLAGLKVTGDAEVGEVGLRTAWSRGAAKRCGKMLKDAERCSKRYRWYRVYISIHQCTSVLNDFHNSQPYHSISLHRTKGKFRQCFHFPLSGSVGSFWIVVTRPLVTSRQDSATTRSALQAKIRQTTEQWNELFNPERMSTEGIWRHLKASEGI